MMPALSVIDLHRHVYHPAGLGAKEADAYFLQGVRRELNGKRFTVPSRIGQALLSVLYIVKSLMRSEPAGHYLLDFALILNGMSKDEYKNLVQEADQKNLLRALSLAVNIMQTIPIAPDELRPLLAIHSFKTLSPYDIFEQLISPGTRNIKMGLYILRCATEVGDFKKGLVWEIGRKLAQGACHAGLF